MLSVMSNFHVADDWCVCNYKLTKLHICGNFPNENLGFDLSSGDEKNPEIFWQTKTRKFWAYCFVSVAIRSQENLFNLAFYTLLLIVRCIFILSQENLKRTSLVGDSVHAVDLKIHPAIKRSPPNHILKFKLTSRIRILLLADSLVDFWYLKSLTPNFAHQPIKLYLWRIFRIRIVRILYVLVEIQFPVLIFILNSPLHNTHVANWSAHYCSILEDLNRLNHTCVTTETSCGCHISFLYEIKLEVSYF